MKTLPALLLLFFLTGNAISQSIENIIQQSQNKFQSRSAIVKPALVVDGVSIDETRDIPEMQLMGTLYTQWKHGTWWSDGKPVDVDPQLTTHSLFDLQVVARNSLTDEHKEPKLEAYALEHGSIMLGRHGLITAPCGTSKTSSDEKSYRMFPFDRMYCHLDIASTRFSQHEVVLSWDGFQEMMGVKPGVTLGRSVDNALKEFHIRAETEDGCGGDDKDGPSCLRVGFSFERRWSPYLIYYFVPCAVLVCMSWLAFWLKRGKGITARIIIALFTGSVVYYITWCFTSERPGTRITILEMYAAACLILIILSLVETVIVHAMRKKKWKRSSHGDVEEYPVYEEKPLVSFIVTKHEKAARRIDRTAAVVFPLIFLAFNIAFWLCMFLL